MTDSISSTGSGYLARTTALPISGADFSYTLAFKVVTNPANTGGNSGSGDVDVISHLIRAAHDQNTHYLGAFGSGIFGSRGLYMSFKDGGGANINTLIVDTNTVLGEWLVCGYTRNGTTGATHFYVSRYSDPTNYLVSHSIGTTSIPGANNPEHALLRALDDGLTNAHCRIAAFKCWAAELTESEVQTEWTQRAPAKASPYLYLPLSVVTGAGQADAGLDSSGNGRNYTVVTTLSADADEPWVAAGPTVTSVPLVGAVRAPGLPKRSLARSGFGQMVAGVQKLGTGLYVAPEIQRAVAVPSEAIRVNPQPRTLGYPARRPAPPQPQLGLGMLVVGPAAAGAVTSTVAGDITSDFSMAATATETIPATVAASIEGDFTVAATATETFTSTGAASIESDFTVASSVTETIPGTVAASITSDFTVAGTSTVANPVSGTIAADITSDFTVASALTETIPATAAASIENDFTVAASGTSVSGISCTVAASIENDFTVASSSTVANPVSATVAVSIGSDFTVAGTATETIPSAAAITIDGDFTVAASVTAANNVTSTIAVAITNDFTVAASGSSLSNGDFTLAAAITNDFVVSGTATETIQSTGAVDITADFAPAVIALLEFTSTGAATIANDFSAAAAASQSVPSAVAVDIASDFIVAASVQASNDTEFSVSANIAGDFSVAASGSVIQNVDGAAAIDITSSFAVNGYVLAGAIYAAPTAENAPRVAVISRRSRFASVNR